MITHLLIASAAAGSSWNLPGASPRAEAPTYAVSAGPGVILLGSGPLPSTRLSGEAAKGNVTVNGSTTLYLGQSTERFDVLGLRWLLVDRPRLRVAPILSVGQHSGPSALDWSVKTRAGVALEAGGERIFFDASLSLLGMGVYPGASPISWGLLGPLDTLVASELGANVLVRPGHWVRLGLFGVLPCLRYIHEGERLRWAATVATLGSQANLGQLEVGVRF